MPKLITNLREMILKTAREELLASGYENLALRKIAKACSIAVGTIYNYFPSKELLCAAVMLDDWLLQLRQMQEKCTAAGSLPEGLRALYEGVRAYSAIYQSVWTGYTFSAGARSAFGKRHNLLVQQITDMLIPLLSRFGADASHGVGLLLAEDLLLCAGESELTFDTFLPLAMRLVQK